MAKLFPFQDHQNLPKLGFWVWKQTIWQPCLGVDFVMDKARDPWWGALLLRPNNASGGSIEEEEVMDKAIFTGAICYMHCGSAVKCWN
jgi:hypothetical protein